MINRGTYKERECLICEDKPDAVGNIVIKTLDNDQYLVINKRDLTPNVQFLCNGDVVSIPPTDPIAQMFRTELGLEEIVRTSYGIKYVWRPLTAGNLTKDLNEARKSQ